MHLNGKVAVITGAGSGIGRALSVELASKGATVVACDLNVATAAETIESCVAPQKHHAMQVDVASESSWESLVAQVHDAVGPADILVNNAGVLGQMAPVDELSTDELRWVIDIDLWGVIYGTRAFLGDLKSRPEAALVNVSSLAGLMGSMGNAAYFTAKFGVRGFSEAVRAELASTKVKVSIVFPGIVKTNLGASHPGYTEEERAEAIRLYNSQPGVSPERAARKIASGIERGRSRVLVGPDVWAIDKLVRLAPGNLDRAIHPLIVKMVNKQRPDGRKVFK